MKKAEALERLKKAIDAIPELKNRKRSSPEFEKWRRDTNIAIRNIFGESSSEVKEFPGKNDFEYVSFGEVSEKTRHKYYVEKLEKVALLLESMLDQVREYWKEEKEAPELPSDYRVGVKDTVNKVFIVHGRDEGTKDTVARFLEKLDLVPVTLAEKPGKGLTIIEKFEQHTQVGFAIVLLTPDDAGSLQDDENNLSPRARQNVIFELGFFIGRIGRERVCALTKGEVEIPSNYAGIEYIPLDASGGWKQKLFRELGSVGFKVDANQVF